MGGLRLSIRSEAGIDGGGKPIALSARMTVIVLFGGRSDERHVSVASAQNVVRTLGAPLAWFWAPNGAVYDVNLPGISPSVA